MLTSLPNNSALAHLELVLLAPKPPNWAIIALPSDPITAATWKSIVRTLGRFSELVSVNIHVTVLQDEPKGKGSVDPAVAAFFGRSTDALFPKERQYDVTITID